MISRFHFFTIHWTIYPLISPNRQIKTSEPLFNKKMIFSTAKLGAMKHTAMTEEMSSWRGEKQPKTGKTKKKDNEGRVLNLDMNTVARL